MRWYHCKGESKFMLSFVTARHKYEAIHRLDAGRVLIAVTQTNTLPAWQSELCTNGHGRVKSSEPHARFYISSEGQTRSATVRKSIIHYWWHDIALFHCLKLARRNGYERCVIAEGLSAKYLGKTNA